MLLLDVDFVVGNRWVNDLCCDISIISGFRVEISTYPSLSQAE